MLAPAGLSTRQALSTFLIILLPTLYPPARGRFDHEQKNSCIDHCHPAVDRLAGCFRRRYIHAGIRRSPRRASRLEPRLRVQPREGQQKRRGSVRLQLRGRCKNPRKRSGLHEKLEASDQETRRQRLWKLGSGAEFHFFSDSGRQQSPPGYSLPEIHRAAFSLSS